MFVKGVSMMKKNISKLILLVVSLVLVVGCTATKNSNENDKADVLSKISQEKAR